MVVEGLPQNGLNRGIAISNVKIEKGFKHSELATVTSSLGSQDQYLGLLKLWNQYHLLNTPIMSMTELSNNVIYTDGLGQALTYSVPYKVSLPFIVEDICGTNDKVGLNKEPFYIVLNTNRYTKGDILTYDRRNGLQAYVDYDEDVKPYNAGAFIYKMRLKTDDRSKYIPRKFLKEGTEWFKITNVKSEWSTENSTITNDSDGITTMRFETGQSLQSVEHWFTGHSDMVEIKGLGGGLSKEALARYCDPRMLSIMYMYETLGDPNDPANPDMRNKSKMVGGSGRWMPKIMEMLYREQAKMQEANLMWNDGGTVFDARGTAVRVGMGLYPQLKMGRHIQYSDTSQLLSILKNVIGDLFSGRADLPTHMRHVVFEMGMGAMIEIQKSFQQEFKNDNPFVVMATHPALSGLITGDNMNLNYNGYRIVSYTFPECGKVEIKHNPALDFEGTRSETTRYGRYSNASYSVLVKDLTEGSFSNAMPKNGVYSVADGFNNGANIVMVKPKNYAETYTAFRVGVYCPDILKQYVGAGANSHIASMDEHGFKVVVHWAGEVWLRDSSRTVLIERIDPYLHH
jgi:hypothetical protein